jgi:hypothetical protein
VRSNAQHKQLEAMTAAQAEREKALHEAEEAQLILQSASLLCQATKSPRISLN